jgi:hypothetical protein
MAKINPKLLHVEVQENQSPLEGTVWKNPQILRWTHGAEIHPRDFSILILIDTQSHALPTSPL